MTDFPILFSIRQISDLTEQNTRIQQEWDHLIAELETTRGNLATQGRQISDVGKQKKSS
jgi:hypothetical protein